MTRIAVTGAGGYVGGRLVAQLVEEGADVQPLVRRAVPWLPDAAVVDLLHVTAEALATQLDGADAVVHLAGHDEVAAAQDPERALLETIAMAHRTARAAALAGVPRVVHLSTIHVYGAALQPGAVVTEEVLPAPRAEYAMARLTGEHVFAAGLAGRAELVVLRLSNSVGAPVHPTVDRWTLLVNDLFRQAATEGRLVLRSAGLQHRDWVDLGDVCRAIAAASRAGQVAPGTYNLATGRSATVREVADLAADAWEEVTGERIAVEAPASSEPATDPYRIDISRLTAEGVRLDTPLPEAVLEVASFCHRNRDQLEART